MEDSGATNYCYDALGQIQQAGEEQFAFGPALTRRGVF